MSFTPEMVAEMKVLALFDLNSTQEGLKVHHTADPVLIEAAKRLYDKDLITQTDGGYLTSLGRDSVENVKTLLSILTTETFVKVPLKELA